MGKNRPGISLCFSIAAFTHYIAVRDEFFSGQKRVSRSNIFSGTEQIKDIALPLYS